MGPTDANDPANADGTYDKHQWENLTAQLKGETDALAEANSKLDAERLAHAATREDLQSAKNDATALKAVLARTLAHVGNAWQELGGDHGAVDRRRAELEAQLAALK